MASLFSREGDGGAAVQIEGDGPLFDGSWERRIADGIREAQDEIGRDAVQIIQERLDVVLVNPTGFYRSQIAADRQGDVTIVSDSNVIYGPWLEGVGTRNSISTFKGYETFRRSFQEVDRSAPGIGDRVIGNYVDG